MVTNESCIDHMEWEALQKPHEITEIILSSNLPQGSKKIEVWRDESYKLKAKLTGIAQKDDYDKVSGDGTAGKKIPLFQIKGRSLNELANYELHHCYIDRIQKNWTQNGQQRFEASLNTSEIIVTPSFKSEIAWLTDWYLNGPNETSIFPRTTTRKGTRNFERCRNSIDKENTEIKGGYSHSSSRDFAYIETEEIKFILSQVPRELGPKWSNNIGIEYRTIFGDIPNVELRKAISEIVGFIVGRQLLHIGCTLFNGKGHILKQVALSPWGDNVVHICQKSDCAPIDFSLKKMGKIENVVSEIIPTYLHLHRDLRLRDALSFYWISRNMPIGTNLPILASGLEILMNAWLQTNNSKTKGEYMSEKEFNKLLDEELKRISQKLHNNKFSDRIIRRINNSFKLSVNDRFEIFFEEIGLKVGKIEKKAIKARNRMAHGSLGSTDEEREEMIFMTNAYETLFHRTLLKILGYKGTYIDSSTIGFPHRDINEPLI